ncbi:FkbM family methyltransferase [Amylibacter sp.]|nr:FkbM family methyltransferase [Amylibacter sp.]
MNTNSKIHKIISPKYSLKKKIYEIINSFLGIFNLAIVRSSSVPSWSHFYKLGKLYKFQPKTIFDIGVAYGTPSLYEAYPNAFYYLIDPLKESVPFMEQWSNKINSKILNIALGSETGVNQIEIAVRQNIGGTTFLKQVGNADTPIVETYNVPMKRFDEVIKDFETPALCKIDVQGFELEVLKGMTKVLNKIDVFIIECHLIDTLENIPVFTDVLNFLQQNDFVVYDILSHGHRPLDNALAETDLVFVKSKSIFRKDSRWK